MASTEMWSANMDDYLIKLHKTYETQLLSPEASRKTRNTVWSKATIQFQKTYGAQYTMRKLKDRWRALRDKVCKAKRKLRPGSETKPNPGEQWVFDRCEFLLPYISTKDDDLQHYPQPARIQKAGDFNIHTHSAIHFHSEDESALNKDSGEHVPVSCQSQPVSEVVEKDTHTHHAEQIEFENEIELNDEDGEPPAKKAKPSYEEIENEPAYRTHQSNDMLSLDELPFNISEMQISEIDEEGSVLQEIEMDGEMSNLSNDHSYHVNSYPGVSGVIKSTFNKFKGADDFVIIDDDSSDKHSVKSIDFDFPKKSKPQKNDEDDLRFEEMLPKLQKEFKALADDKDSQDLAKSIWELYETVEKSKKNLALIKILNVFEELIGEQCIEP